MALAAIARDKPAPRARRGFNLRAFLFAVLVATIGFLVLYPLALVVGASFEVGAYGRPATLGFGNWLTVIAEPGLRAAMLNTITLTATRQLLGLGIALVLAWLLARTNLPSRQWLEFGFWISFFLPTLPVLLGWIFLLDSHSGLVNRLLQSTGWFNGPLFDVYSWWGIVFVHLMTNTIGLKVMLLTPVFRNLDASLIESARVAGARAWRIMSRIIVPMVLPAVLVVLLLGTLRSLEAFEIELILGPPAKIEVYSTAIYHHVFASPPDYGPAFALSTMVFAIMAPFVLIQQSIGRRHARAGVSSRFSAAITDLGFWRWPIFAGFLLLLGAMTVLPVAFMILGSFMEVFGYFDVPGGIFTVDHWTEVLGDAQFLGALRDTLVIALCTAVASMLVFPGLAYLIVRTRYIGRGALDFLTWVPTTVPGIVIGLALLGLFLQTPLLRPIYGTQAGLVIAFLLAGMALGVQLIKTGIMQIALELEEAGHTGGASSFDTMRRIVLPLVAPTIAVVGVLEFVAATRSVSTAVLLSSHATQTMTVFQLKFIEAGDMEAASVVGVVVLALSTGVALIARIFGLRLGIGLR